MRGGKSTGIAEGTNSTPLNLSMRVWVHEGVGVSVETKGPAGLVSSRFFLSVFNSQDPACQCPLEQLRIL